jgi:hypothetical protein
MLQCAVWQKCADVSECLAASIIRVKPSCLVDRGRFWSLPAFICRISTINSSSFDSTFWINLSLWSLMNILNTPFTNAHVIMNPLPLSYSKVRSVMYQLCNRTVNEKHLLIVVNCFSMKRSIFNKWKHCTFMFHVIMLFYISFPSWPNINALCIMIDREKIFFFSLD